MNDSPQSRLPEWAGGCHLRETGRFTWSGPSRAAEARHLAAGAGAYVGYWAVMLTLYWVGVRRLCRRRAGGYRVQV